MKTDLFFSFFHLDNQFNELNERKKINGLKNERSDRKSFDKQSTKSKLQSKGVSSSSNNGTTRIQNNV